MERLERIVEISPAWDKRNRNPAKNYGIGDVNMRFVLKGERGAVQFLLATNWHLPHNQRELDASNAIPRDPHYFCRPRPYDLGYHSPTPCYEGQDCIDDACEYLDGKPCYYDGSTQNAEKPYEILLTEGGDGLWKYLEEYYNRIFDESTDSAAS